MGAEELSGVSEEKADADTAMNADAEMGADMDTDADTSGDVGILIVDIAEAEDSAIAKAGEDET